MQSSWLITVAKVVWHQEKKWEWNQSKLNLPRQSKPEMPNSFWFCYTSLCIPISIVRASKYVFHNAYPSINMFSFSEKDWTIFLSEPISCIHLNLERGRASVFVCERERGKEGNCEREREIGTEVFFLSNPAQR